MLRNKKSFILVLFVVFLIVQPTPAHAGGGATDPVQIDKTAAQQLIAAAEKACLTNPTPTGSQLTSIVVRDGSRTGKGCGKTSKKISASLVVEMNNKCRLGGLVSVTGHKHCLTETGG